MLDLHLHRAAHGDGNPVGAPSSRHLGVIGKDLYAIANGTHGDVARPGYPLNLSRKVSMPPIAQVRQGSAADPSGRHHGPRARVEVEPAHPGRDKARVAQGKTRPAIERGGRCLGLALGLGGGRRLEAPIARSLGLDM